MHIIIKGREEDRARLKGKTITELAKNLESEGWPSEFRNEEERDRVKYLERKKGHYLQPGDVPVDGRPEKVREFNRLVVAGKLRKGKP